MPLTVVYDSGATTGVAPDVWHEYRGVGDPSPAPVWVCVKLDPFQEVSNTWNLWGYACAEYFDANSVIMLPQTELSAAGAKIPSNGTSKRVGQYTILKMLDFRQVGTKPNGFRAVHFCINRWVGPTRVRVGFIT